MIKELGKRIKYIRITNKIKKQKDLANILGVNVSRIKSLELGIVKKLSSEELDILVREFNINSKWILTGEGTMNLKDSWGLNNLEQYNIKKEDEEQIKNIISLLQYAPSVFKDNLYERLLQFKANATLEI